MISVIIPALNEAKRVGSVVALARRDPDVCEVLVIDDGSTDETALEARAAGARVLTSTLLGKGASMEDGMREAANEVLLYLDGDLSGLPDDVVQRMTRPILLGEADFVKARFSRSAGRVTALTARPLLRTFFPELAHFAQPLGGIIAARRSLLERLCFENDYGVDVGLFLDAAMTGARLAEVDIGHIEHESQPLEALGEMAFQVTRTLLDRAARNDRLCLGQVLEAEEIERHTRAELQAVLKKLGKLERLALFDMDGVLLDGRFIESLARRTDRSAALAEFLDQPHLVPEERTRRIARLFAGVPREVFERAARDVPLMAGAVDTVVSLRRAGYRVGIVTDSYLVASEVVRRRVFADFSFAHRMKFSGRIATGEVTLSPAMAHERGCCHHDHCKANVLYHLQERTGIGVDEVLAVGDGENDICLLEAAGMSVAFHPKAPGVQAVARHTVTGALSDILTFLGVSTPTPPAGANPLPAVVVEPGPSLGACAWG